MTSVVSFSAPDLGTGYAKLAKPGINTISGLRSACSQSDYATLLTSYCTQNSAAVHQEVVTYDSQGSVTSAGGGPFGSDPVSCPAAASQLPSVDGFTAAVSGSSVNLSWLGHAAYPTLAANNNSINIYRGTTADFVPSATYGIPSAQINLIAQGNVLSYADANLAPGTYYYKVAWQDINGVVGPYSPAVSATIAASLPPPSTPAGIEAYWGAGGPAPAYDGLYSQQVRFTYAGDIASVQSFRLYQLYRRQPGEGAFSIAATFSNPASLLNPAPTGSSCTSTIRVGVWKLFYCAYYAAGYWVAETDSQVAGTFAVGEYQSYVTAVSTSGSESSPSANAYHFALDRATILAPIGPQTTLTPTFRWTAASGWPSTPSYSIQVYDPTRVVWTASVSVGLGATEGSKVYDGSVLEGGKSYTVSIRASLGTADRKAYMAMSAGTQTFSVASAATTSAATERAGALASVLNAISRLLAELTRTLGTLR